MLGWWIMISTLNYEETKAADTETVRENILAQWETFLDGADWIEELEINGKALKIVNKYGYPNVYEAKAGDVLPLLGTDAVLSDIRKTPPMQQHSERIAACKPEQILTLEVWDLS